MKYYQVCANSEYACNVVDMINGHSYVCEFKLLKEAKEYLKKTAKELKERFNKELVKENKKGNTITLDLEVYEVPNDYNNGMETVGDYEYIGLKDSRYLCGRY